MARPEDPLRRLAESIKNPRFVSRPIDWTECPPEMRAAEANRATILGPAVCDRPDDAVIRKAFEEWGLDPANPWNWRLLLFYFADARFSMVETDRKRWRWSQSDRIDLLQRFEKETWEAKERGVDSPTDTELLKRLRANPDYGYNRIQFKALHKRLIEARKMLPP